MTWKRGSCGQQGLKLLERLSGARRGQLRCHREVLRTVYRAASGLVLQLAYSIKLLDGRGLKRGGSTTDGLLQTDSVSRILPTTPITILPSIYLLSSNAHDSSLVQPSYICRILLDYAILSMAGVGEAATVCMLLYRSVQHRYIPRYLSVYA